MIKVSLIMGDGIGPEVISSAVEIIDKTGVKIDWNELTCGAESIKKYGVPLTDNVIESIKENKIALKGPVTTPIGEGFRSINVALRQSLNLYANVRPVKTIPGIKTKFDGVDLVIVRENTEDLYAGVERMANENRAESIKIITREASLNIVKFAFSMAKREERKKVTAVHKANIMKLSDGLFLKCAREVSKEFSEISFEEMIVDAMSMKLVMEPEKYDVLVMPNLYGDILSDLCAGLVGGLGVVPGANIGDECAVFEPVHGSAPDIAGLDMANPTAAILSGVMLLRYLKELKAAEQVENALFETLKCGLKTKDIGGTLGTKEFTKEVIKRM